MQRARRVVLAAVRQGTALRLPQAAASLAFLSLLALVPVFTIAVSLLGALPMFSKLRDALLKFLAANLFLPSFSETLVRYLNQFAAKASQLSLIGALLFFASAFSALLTIDHTLNRIWRVERARPLARRLTIYWTFLTLGPLLLAGSVTINGVIASEFLGGARLALVERLWLDVLPWIITIGGLTLLYRLVPNAPVGWRDAFAGAIAAAVLLEVLKQVLGVQVARLPTYTVVYGTFAALPMFLVWLFLVWLTVLVGALVSANLPYWDEGEHAHLPPGPARRFESAAGVLHALVRAVASGQAALPAGSLRAVFGGDPERAIETARLLAELGYLDRHWQVGDADATPSEPGVWDERWLLAPGAARMTLRPLFERLWAGSDAVAGPKLDVGALDRPLGEAR
jgi:membrane protein